MRVNFSVTNQLATPSIHAAALANRPPAGQPGRLFVDTDNPSSGIYRDTGTVWENITGGAGAGNLQTVTDAGNTTDNNILLTYPDNTLANALVFYNDQLAQEEYLIEKRGTGITTNDSLVIQSRGNIAPSTNPAGIMIDGANDVIKSFYTTSYTDIGLKLDFANGQYWLGNSYFNGLGINPNSGYYVLGDSQGNVPGLLSINILPNQLNIQDAAAGFANFIVNNAGTSASEVNLTIQNDSALGDFIKTRYNNNEIGLKLDFANNVYELGDINNTYGLNVSNANGIILGDNSGNIFGTSNTLEIITDTIKTKFNGNDIGLKLDFGIFSYKFGDFNITNNGVYLECDDDNGIIRLYSGSGYQNFEGDGSTTTIGDFGGAGNQTKFGVDDTNQKLIASSNLLVGSSGSSSGQHLKIKIGTTDYVIELKNP